MIGNGTDQLGNRGGNAMTRQLTTTGAARASAAPITAADQARIDQALRDARASNTRRQYRSAWKGWAEWAGLQGHQALPADPAAVAAYLAERTEQGAAASTVRAIRAAIGAAHRDAGAADPTAHDGVRRVLQGLTRQAAGRGRGQAQGLTADDCAAILATASIPRRTGRGLESETAAAERGAVDKALVGLLFQGGLRRSEAAALRWADVQDATDGRGIVWSTFAARKPTRPAPPRMCATSRTAAPWRCASSATGSPCSAQGCARSRQTRCSAASTASPSRAASPPPQGPPASQGGSPGTPGASASPAS